MAPADALGRTLQAVEGEEQLVFLGKVLSAWTVEQGGSAISAHGLLLSSG
jgi:hypothetical protein